MKIIANEQVLMIDVDDTLVLWRECTYNDTLVKIKNPYDDLKTTLVVHEGHLKILKDRKARGSTIVVWSSGGYRWAEAVVKALCIEEYVDFVMTKPFAYMDDLPAEKILGERIYLGLDSSYGKK